MQPTLGVVFDRAYPAAMITDYARRAEAGGLSHLWVIEDCFFTAGISLAAFALASTERLHVGLGILPAVARNPAITAMEIATLANAAPGRVIAGIGHGVQDWMAQMGARPRSALTTLRETLTVVKALLDGAEVSLDGQAITMDAVRLDAPPAVTPLVVAGVEQTKSMAIAGRFADGLVLTEGAGPTFVRWALEAASRDADDFHVTTYSMLVTDPDRKEAYRSIAPFVAELVAANRAPLRMLPFFDEMQKRIAAGGAEALVTMPRDYWLEIGPIGTVEDAADFVAALGAIGVRQVAFYPGADPDDGWRAVQTAASLVG